MKRISRQSKKHAIINCLLAWEARIKRTFIASLLFLQFSMAAVSWACDLPQPVGEAILIIDGEIGACNVDREARFDRVMIEALPATEVRTRNPWEHGRVAYQGVLLRDLLQYVKARGKVLDISALNDFHTEISVADAESYNILLAYRREGVDLTVRDKGPFFIVFPFSEISKLETEERFAQSIWQVSHISVR